MIETVLPLALVIAASPLPIMPAVLLLMTPRARSNALGYLAAWLAALSALVLVALGLGSLADPAPATEQEVNWIQLVTGGVFLALGLLKWLRRPRADAAVEPPGWMAKLDSYTPRESARLGALIAVNPKNLVMALAAGAEIALLASGPGAAVVAAVVFVLVGSAGVIAPIGLYLAAGERSEPTLRRAKVWLEANGTALAAGVMVVLGLALLVKAVPGLAG